MQLIYELDKICLVILLIVFISCEGNKANNAVVKNEELQIEGKADSFRHAKNNFTAALLYTKLIALDSTKGKYYFRRGVLLFTIVEC